jgi:DNA-binding MarR family transcriptional regulator
MNDLDGPVSHIKKAALEIIRRLDQLTPFQSRESELPRCSMPFDALLVAKAWRRANQVRRESFKDGTDLFAEPAWEMLLDLYISAQEGRAVAVSSLCLASHVPPTTALRWIERLGTEGLVHRHPDELDGRRIFVELTEEGRARIEGALDAAASSDRRLGLGRLQAVQ